MTLLAADAGRTIVIESEDEEQLLTTHDAGRRCEMSDCDQLRVTLCSWLDKRGRQRGCSRHICANHRSKPLRELEYKDLCIVCASLIQNGIKRQQDRRLNTCVYVCVATFVLILLVVVVVAWEIAE